MTSPAAAKEHSTQAMTQAARCVTHQTTLGGQMTSPVAAEELSTQAMTQAARCVAQYL